MVTNKQKDRITIRVSVSNKKYRKKLYQLKRKKNLSMSKIGALALERYIDDEIEKE